MLSIEPEFEPAFAAAGLVSPEAICRKFLGDARPLETGVAVQPVEFDFPGRGRVALFFKLYSYRRPAWQFVGRASKARCEFRNYHVFEQLGIRTAQRVACGEERDWLGRLRGAFILTEAILGAMILTEFFQTTATREHRDGKTLRQSLLRQLAGMTRRAHDAGFFHHDLVWRNLLVTRTPPGEPQLWWIDCPRGQFDRGSPWRGRRRIKDLASLDKVASQVCTRSERAAFVREYLGLNSLDAGARRLIRAALNYRRTRWPEDWVGGEVS
jgi:tRNA A-37 threonylcarbamoyl transferase component Bud32